MADFARHASAMLQGTEEYNLVVNTPDIVTSPLTGLPSAYTHICHFVGGASREGLTWRVHGVNQTGPTADHIIATFYVRFSDLSPTTEYRCFALGSSSGSIINGTRLNFILETGGDVRVEDDADAEVATITGPFTVDTWHKIDIRYFPSATVGEVQMWVDDTEVLANQTGQTFASHPSMVGVLVGGSPTSGE